MTMMTGAEIFTMIRMWRIKRFFHNLFVWAVTLIKNEKFVLYSNGDMIWLISLFGKEYVTRIATTDGIYWRVPQTNLVFPSSR